MSEHLILLPLLNRQTKGTGPQAVTLTKTFLDALPPLRPLAIFLKYFLQARALHEPYSGGVGSFTLLMMLIAFFQQRERESIKMGKKQQYNLGSLLIEFFELFGDKFNYCTTGISVRHDGKFFAKGAMDRKENFFTQNRPFSLALENPLEPDNDSGRGSFRIQTVQKAFSKAHKLLLAHVAAPVMPTHSILATIIPCDDMDMQQRKLKRQISTTQQQQANGGKSTSSSQQERQTKRARFV